MPGSVPVTVQQIHPLPQLAGLVALGRAPEVVGVNEDQLALAGVPALIVGDLPDEAVW